ncbi:MAG TPA: sigma-54 dependent transcriptional regulator [Polyangia bacterium]
MLALQTCPTESFSDDLLSPAQVAVVGQSPALQAAMKRALLMAPHMVSVLVTGESGTGKELFARVLHERGPSPTGPMVAVNCGALSRELAESELFGHERGAFTGASDRRTGWFEEASGGTLVLDEVGELPLDLQPKLLRVLETGRLRRVGGRGEIAVKVRVVALTLRDLAREAAEGRFRIDLYHRLAGFELRLPPLRARREDIPRLADQFVKEAAEELQRPRVLAPSALDRLLAHTWPGNVRELRNVVRRAAFLCEGIIAAEDLDLDLDVRRDAWPPPSAPSGPQPLRPTAPSPWSSYATGAADAPLGPPTEAAGAHAENGAKPPAEEAEFSLKLRGRSYEELQKEILIFALRENGGSRRQAARALSLSRSTFCDWCKRFGL